MSLLRNLCEKIKFFYYIFFQNTPFLFARLVQQRNFTAGVSRMKDFQLPSNIKQIGSIGDGLRIYMEDYVCTFLQQYAESAGFEERLAFLLGKHMVIDGQQYLFINGALYGRYAEKFEGHLRFSEKSIIYADESLDEFFSGMEIVGWAQSQPSYGTYLNQFYAAYHLRQFRRPHQVLFVLDPLERANAFYAANPTAKTPAERVAEIPGYFIYYEKNTQMHEYMLVNKSVEYTTKTPTLIEFTPLEYAKDEPNEPKISRYKNDGFDRPREKNYNKSYDDYDEEKSPVAGYGDDFFDDKHGDERYSLRQPPRNHTDPEDIIRRREVNKARRKGVSQEQKRTSNMLAGLCAVLFVICFIMGVGLIRNQERMETYSEQVRLLTDALRGHISADIDLSDPNSIAHAFAEDTTPVNLDVPALPGDVDLTLPPVQPQQPTTDVTTPVYVPVPVYSPEPTLPPTTVYTPPSATAENPALVSPIPETYIVQPGDSLLAIALYFFGDANMVNEILALNGLTNPDMIVAGHTINLPRR